MESRSGNQKARKVWGDMVKGRDGTVLPGDVRSAATVANRSVSKGLRRVKRRLSMSSRTFWD
jgi:hypothetical protein